MMSEHSMKILSEFRKMPKTPEKEAINKAYLNDEIGNFELLQKAEAYIASNVPHEARG